MSAISSTGAGQGLYQFLSQISGNSTSAAGASVTADSTAASSPTQSDGTQAAQGHHHHHHGGGQMFQQLQSAVTSALQSAQSNGSSDPNQVIQNAIENFFKSHEEGQTTQAAANGTAGATTGTPNMSDPDGDGDHDATSSVDGDGGNSARSAFFQTLKSFGVDPQQFRADLAAAMKDAQGGQVDPNAAFKSFPPGSGVDTTA